MFEKASLAEAIKHLPKARILVLGDVMLDVFVWGRVNRISPEAPVPVVDVMDESQRLGGAANVVNNLVSLEAQVILAGVVGNDEIGKLLIKEVKKLGVDPAGLIIDEDRPTTVKTRIIAHSQQVVRVDKEKRQPLKENTIKQLLNFIEAHLNELDAILISDYAKGVICPSLIADLKVILKNKNILVTVDPKVKNIHLYKEMTLVTPNHYEAIQASGFNGITDVSEELIITAGKKLLAMLNSQAVLITRGEAGMSLFEKNGAITHIPAVAKKVYDVTGAGDTVIATLTAAWASGAKLKEAAILANLAAGIVVGEVGTATVSRNQLLQALT
ncbi:MAG: D-glycero-beta-D-manno-heptose-7-phosphate kinase [Candidatus Desulfofervidaceae bacterium]|nr:D-glycero-beta-D-manno-heptose-7-phosphate kinase [Candidatus Desulfofervidaceae bacterium]MDL1971030.1 D-glycero-beta-D-manno-heptose-7-phosphate kinase [Candidatus Desulfofervidaceae bacterium]